MKCDCRVLSCTSELNWKHTECCSTFKALQRLVQIDLVTASFPPERGSQQRSHHWSYDSIKWECLLVNWGCGYPFRSNDLVVLLPTRARQRLVEHSKQACAAACIQCWKAGHGAAVWDFLGGGRSLSPELDMPGTRGLGCAFWWKFWKSVAKSSVASRGEMANLPCRGVWLWWQVT